MLPPWLLNVVKWNGPHSFRWHLFLLFACVASLGCIVGVIWGRKRRERRWMRRGVQNYREAWLPVIMVMQASCFDWNILTNLISVISVSLNLYSSISHKVRVFLSFEWMSQWSLGRYQVLNRWVECFPLIWYFVLYVFSTFEITNPFLCYLGLALWMDVFVYALNIQFLSLEFSVIYLAFLAYNHKSLLVWLILKLCTFGAKRG